MYTLLALCCVAAVAWAGPYTGQQVLRLHPTTDEQTAMLDGLAQRGSLGLDFWGRPATGQDVDVRVLAQSISGVEDLLKAQKLSYDVIIDDVQALVDAENASNAAVVAPFGSKRHWAVGKYARTSDIYDLMRTLAKKYSRVAELIPIGSSYEGRELLVLKLSSGGAGKQSVFLNSGFHSREWIASASTVWMMNEMVTQYGDNSQITALVDKYDWYFLPMANPDGYEFSHTGNRFWRKTRSRGMMCYGADPNRNWDAQFGGEGTSGFQCSDIYRGKHAFSEPETAAQAKFLKTLMPSLAMYYDIHAYSELWFVPYGYSARAAPPADDAELRRVAAVGKAAIRNYGGRVYKIGTPPQILYAAAGGAYDWCKQEGVKYAYALELRPNGGGMNGFVVDAREIVDSGKETLAGILAAADAMKL